MRLRTIVHGAVLALALVEPRARADDTNALANTRRTMSEASASFASSTASTDGSTALTAPAVTALVTTVSTPEPTATTPTPTTPTPEPTTAKTTPTSLTPNGDETPAPAPESTTMTPTPNGDETPVPTPEPTTTTPTTPTQTTSTPTAPTPTTPTPTTPTPVGDETPAPTPEPPTTTPTTPTQTTSTPTTPTPATPMGDETPVPTEPTTTTPTTPTETTPTPTTPTETTTTPTTPTPTTPTQTTPTPNGDETPAPTPYPTPTTPTLTMPAPNGYDTPAPTPELTTMTPSTTPPNHTSDIHQSPSSPSGSRADDTFPSSAPTPEPVPVPAPSPQPTTFSHHADTGNTSAPPPPTTTEAPESPPPPVAEVPSELQPSQTPATETSSSATSPVPDAGSPSPPRYHVRSISPVVDPESREASTSNDSAPTPEPTSPSPTSTVEVTVTDSSSTQKKTTPRPKAYRRGDNVIVVHKNRGDGTTEDVEVVLSPSASPAVLVRSASTQTSGSTSSSSSAIDTLMAVLRMTMAILAFASLLVLVLFHFMALQPSWTAPLSVLARPNQWELLAFITYLQAMASTAQYIMWYAPVALWKFVDTFSWTVFIPFHYSSSGVSSRSTSTGSRRRLSDVVVLDGIVAFADRIGVDETDLLKMSAAGLVICCGILALLVGVAVAVIKYKSRTNTRDAHNAYAIGSVPGVVSVFRRNAMRIPPMHIVYGVAVVFVVFALYPVTLLATFEIASEVRADQVSGSSLAIALLLLAAVPVALTVRSVTVLALIPSEDAFRTHWKHRAVWGVLSSSESVKYDKRVSVAIAWLAMQLASAVIVGAVASDVWQIVLLLTVDVAFVGTILALRPFAVGQRFAGIFTVTVGILKAINTALSFVFVSASGHHNAAATAFIVLNSLALTLWFLRIAWIAMRVIRCVRNPEPLVRELLDHASSVSSSDAAYASTLFVALPTTRDGYHGPRQAIL